jgi:hypothetical protein
VTEQDLTAIEERAHRATRWVTPWADDAMTRSHSDALALLADLRLAREQLADLQAMRARLVALVRTLDAAVDLSRQAERRARRAGDSEGAYFSQVMQDFAEQHRLRCLAVLGES